MKVRVEGLEVRYSGAQERALQEVNLALEPGTVTLVSGPCGSGKTTLLHCLNGIIPHLFEAELKGRVILGGEEGSGSSLARVSGLVGTVLQDPEAQIFNLRVEDEIAFGCENLGLAPGLIRERVQDQGRRFALDPTARTAILSGGQKQRLVIASVLAMDRPLLLLDEPLAHLDQEGAAMLGTLLKDFRAAGRIVVMAEHRLDLVLPLVDRVVWLEQGRVRVDLPAQEAAGQLPAMDLLAPGRPFPGPAGPPLASLKGATVGSNGRVRLEGVDLEVTPGDRVTLLGPNGAGKTTLLRTLAGLGKPDRGRAERSGLAPGQGVGYVFQTPGYQLFMDSVQAEVEIGSSSPERAREILDLFGLWELRKRHPHSLSEGQKRLLSVAAALAPKPALLCLDEPTVGQDSRSLGRLLQALDRTLDQERTALVAATHDPRCALALGGKCVWLDQGRIRERGGAELAQRYFNQRLDGDGD